MLIIFDWLKTNKQKKWMLFFFFTKECQHHYLPLWHIFVICRIALDHAILVLIFFSFYFNWRLITLQYCGVFCHTLNMNQPWVYMMFLPYKLSQSKIQNSANFIISFVRWKGWDWWEHSLHSRFNFWSTFNHLKPLSCFQSSRGH